MSGKPYGKFTLEQFKRFNQLFHESRHLAPELETVIQEAEPDKLKRIFGDGFSWFSFYELTFKEHMAKGIFILGWQDDLHHIAKAPDPQQAFFDFFQKKLEEDEDWTGGYQGRFEKKDLIGLLISIFRTMKSLMVYQKSLSTLVDEVREGCDNSLFDAVRIDRTVIACTPIAHRISMAELKGEKNFFVHLKKAVKGPSQKHMVALEPLRYMMAALVDTGGVNLSSREIEELFVDHLKLYQKDPGAQKNLYEQFLKTKKIYHRK